MVEPVEDKGVLGRKLEEDRKKLAIQVGELREDYNPVRKVAVSIRKDPLAWIIATALVGILLSRLLGRTKEILLSTESVDRTRSQELPPLPSDEDESSETKKLLALAKWAIGTYLIREFDRCIVQPCTYVAERIVQSRLTRNQTEIYLHELQNWIEKHGQSLPSLQNRLNRMNLFLRRVLHRQPFERLLWQTKAKPHRFWHIFL
jgi:hypothetical protein